MPAYSTLYEILLYLLLLGNVCVKKKLLITLEIPTITKNHDITEMCVCWDLLNTKCCDECMCALQAGVPDLSFFSFAAAWHAVQCSLLITMKERNTY